MIVSPVFLDTNVFMYAAGAPHRFKEPCVAVLEQRRFDGAINTEIIQEMLYRYSHIGLAEKGVELCREMLKYRLTIIPVSATDAALAVDLFDEHRASGIRPRDAVHAATMRNNGIVRIVSTDRDFDVFPFLRRAEPAAFLASL